MKTELQLRESLAMLEKRRATAALMCGISNLEHDTKYAFFDGAVAACQMILGVDQSRMDRLLVILDTESTVTEDAAIYALMAMIKETIHG